jgi:hypothetical protein
VWNLRKYGQFDVVFCCGILYHLEEPVKFLRLIGEATKQIAIVNTGFSRPDTTGRHKMSEMCEHEGVEGRWFREPKTQSESHRWAAWNNTRSFWIRREHLMKTMREAGFNMVFEQFDYFDELPMQECLNAIRGMFVGIKVQTDRT